MPSEKLEKLKHERYVAERKLTAAKHKKKRRESEIKRLSRGNRIKRADICVVLVRSVMLRILKFWIQNNLCYDVLILDKEKTLNLMEE